MFYQNEHFARTFYYQGDFSEEINEAFNHYFDDTLELIDLLLECDPEFRIHDHFDEKSDERECKDWIVKPSASDSQYTFKRNE